MRSHRLNHLPAITVAVASWEGDIDREKAHRVLNGEVAAIDMETPLDSFGINVSGAQLQTP